MEKAMSVEDKIKRAEEIYNRRKENQTRANTAKVNVNSKKDIKLFKKMIIQIIVCLAIYSVFYLVKNNNYIFSQDLVNKVKDVLSYDVNFSEIYSKSLEALNSMYTNSEQNAEEVVTEENNAQENTQNVQEEVKQNNGIGGAEEETEENTDKEDKNLTQMEQDAQNIKSQISFITPIQGKITSTFGWRNPTTSTVPKNHTGLDIAATAGTIISSATEGKVILASSKGDYGNHLKIQINNVVIIYAHCKTLYVKQGDQITQGQHIAEVGSTGNSTGPHLHFEIRIDDRLVDPQLILNI